MNKKSITLVFPHQLFKESSALNKDRLVYIFEAPRFFTDYSFHKQKLHFHRATMQAYRDELLEKNYTVHYREYHESANAWLELKNYTEIYYTDPVDTKLENELIAFAQTSGIKLIWHETPAFLSSKQWVSQELSNKKKYSHAPFYTAQRKRLQILIEQDGTPTGQKWSFDTENRKKLPKGTVIPAAPLLEENKFTLEASKYIKKHFPSNPGRLNTTGYPTTRTEAEEWLTLFLKDRLALFGAYEDSIESHEQLLFHSLLSPLLNCGLLTPDYVVKKTLLYAEKNPIPLASLEGFIRQIIGWREFIRGVYVVVGQQQRNSNFFNHQKKLPESFWQGSTGIEPLDSVIKKVLATSYCHHIERLMILSNFMLLCKINPDEVYTWFMELFIDAYDWVMVPNVYGMGQYADGGLMVTKPYISGSNYILKMSNFKKNSWSDTWDALYWNFIASNLSVIKKNQRLSLMADYLKRIPEERLKKMSILAEKELSRLFSTEISYKRRAIKYKIKK